MDKDKLVEALREALLTDEEMKNKRKWADFEDPIFEDEPLWTLQDLIDYAESEDEEEEEEEDDGVIKCQDQKCEDTECVDVDCEEVQRKKRKVLG